MDEEAKRWAEYVNRSCGVPGVTARSGPLAT
jgi:hypothetical protein